jgi:hypothetical protein
MIQKISWIDNFLPPYSRRRSTTFTSSRAEFAGVAICVVAFLIYIAFPTRNFYWDGISFALQIEDAHGLEPMLFNPNHLGFDIAGSMLSHMVRWIFPAVRVHTVLIVVNQILGAVSGLLIFRILRERTTNLYTRVCLTLMFLFSATWWKFSTDANAYVPSTFCLIAAFALLTVPIRPRVVAVGILHALAMLFHQIAILFYFGLAVTILVSRRWQTAQEKIQALLLYTITAGGIVTAAYVLVWTRVIHYQDGSGGFRNFLGWIMANGSEEYIFQSISTSIATTVQSSVRVFFGGRFSLARDFVEAPILFTLGSVFAVSIAYFAVHIIRNIRYVGERANSQPIHKRDLISCVAWIIPFVTFLLFWLTEWPYYRLFYLPAVIAVLALFIERTKARPGSRALAGFVAVMTLSNFIFLIYPYTKSGATPPVHLALYASDVWDSNSIVFYKTFSTDNRTFQYFNRQAQWNTVDSYIPNFQQRICRLNQEGYNTWIDGTALNYLSSVSNMQSLLSSVELRAEPRLLNFKHGIQFIQIRPNCEQIASVSPTE